MGPRNKKSTYERRGDIYLQVHYKNKEERWKEKIPDPGRFLFYLTESG
jgi:hypothetical protein